ncbi:transposase [Tateyamaria sp.]|uniref:transposase n=1 Tax=Tateyamaria sp. TaxID=1929288 RepID=UPI003B21A876
MYFADAVHPEYQTKPSYGWVKAGSNPAVTTTSGRGRVNIHGALNLENFDAPFVEPTTVDGVSAAQLLARIEARNPDKRLIHVIWDNAAYHKGPDVREFLARPDCRIHLIQQRWSREFGPVVKVDRLMRKTIQDEEAKESFC